MPNQYQKHLLIIANIPSENTRLMRDSVLEGAASAETDHLSVIALSPLSASPSDVKNADGIILGTTENFGYMSGALKDFFDRVYYPCLNYTEGMPYAIYIRAGQDGTGTRRAIESITSGLHWKSVTTPLICSGNWEKKFLNQCYNIGKLMAVGIDASIF